MRTLNQRLQASVSTVVIAAACAVSLSQRVPLPLGGFDGDGRVCGAAVARIFDICLFVAAFVSWKVVGALGHRHAPPQRLCRRARQRTVHEGTFYLVPVLNTVLRAI